MNSVLRTWDKHQIYISYTLISHYSILSTYGSKCSVNVYGINDLQVRAGAELGEACKEALHLLVHRLYTPFPSLLTEHSLPRVGV